MPDADVILPGTSPTPTSAPEVVAGIAAQLAALVGGRHVAEHYWRRTARSDLVARDVDDLVGAAVAHWRLAARPRRADETAVRVFVPDAEDDGWSSPHTVVDLVSDDMPHIVTSTTAALSRLGYRLHLAVHPVLAIRRDDAGVPLEVAPDDLLEPGAPGAADAAAAGWRLESFLHLEVDRVTEPRRLTELRDELLAVLADVSLVDRGRDGTRAHAAAVADALEARPPAPGGDPADDPAEAAALLRWMLAGGFTFLGCSEHAPVAGDGAGAPAAGVELVVGRAHGLLDPDRADRGDGAGTLAGDRSDHLGDHVVVVTKATATSTVERAGHLDLVVVPRAGAPGEHRFAGLWTGAAYTAPVATVPVVRRKVASVVAHADFPAGGYSANELGALLELYPRDELFQVDAATLHDTAIGILQLQGREQVRLFVRAEPAGRFVSCIVFVPRDRYRTDVRLAMQDALARAFGATTVEFAQSVSGGPFARLHLVLWGDRLQAAAVDVDDLNRRLARLTRTWEDDLADDLREQFGEEEGRRLLATWGHAFPVAYQADYPTSTAVADLRRARHVGRHDVPASHLYRPPDGPADQRRLKLYRCGDRLSLSALLPVLAGLGVEVVDERPYVLRPADSTEVNVYDIGLRVPSDVALDEPHQRERFRAAFTAVWEGDAEDDGFNRLVLRAGLAWRDVALVRALCKYLRQVGIRYSDAYMADSLVAHPDLVVLLVDLFHARFDPARRSTSVEDQTRAAFRLERGLETVPNLDDDRIIRTLYALVQACVRTNAHQRGPDGAARPALALKFDPARVPDLPLPRPKHEIWVYSPRVEGVHLRAGDIARGGIRWSDRREDFRTEILGLVKAQTVKNAVIVPTGAKGGFVVKRPPADAGRDAQQAEGVDCYQLFIGALLDVTDDLRAGAVVPPADVVRYDDDDPYLVVAADKGTSTFSDVANDIACARGFWLGDAFASGGSEGYDHKEMGITARGAWESVRAHLSELGVDVATDEITVAGIGDMSGDVFGNAMLLSPHLRLVAAFDHRHVFLDPTPDPARSFAERQRLFGLSRSSWADYDATLISPGGGVVPRDAKSYRITPEVRAVLAPPDGTPESVTPTELIALVLRAPVDLLFNGGIGTYVKAATESQADAHDKANDAVRADGREVRARVVGEGGNLGVTQRGRIEYALAGGHINTDAIDNSAGVDCSDHEVNIKVLLDAVVADGDLTTKQRNELLVSMTDEVAELVLADNVAQNQALANARAEAPAMLDVATRHLTALEAVANLDRELEALPGPDALTERRMAGSGLTSPELSVLLAYTKIHLTGELVRSKLPDDPWFDATLVAYFPTPLRERFAHRMRQHRLHREIVAASVANHAVNRGGTSMVHRMVEETAAPAPDIVRAHLVASAVFDADAAWDRVVALPVTGDVRARLLLASRRLVERGTRWIVRNRRAPVDLDATIEALRPAVAEVEAVLDRALVGGAAETAARRAASWEELGVPADVAFHAATVDARFAALDIAEVAAERGAAPADVARVHFLVGDHIRLNWLLDRINALPRDDRWQTLARSALRDDLAREQRALVGHVLAASHPGIDPAEMVAHWEAGNQQALDRCQLVLADVSSGTGDLAQLSVALREVRNLVHQAVRPT